MFWRRFEPSLVLINDPQADESAHSPSQCATRERILAGAILGLAGPGRKIAGLERLTEAKLGREWKTANGNVLRVSQCLIDASWGDSTDVVYQFCRQSPFASVLMPSHGRGVTASSIPFAEYKRKRGDRVGLNWRVPAMVGRRAVRHVVYDTNFWKSFVHSRLMVAMGDPGCPSLFGKKTKQGQQLHRLLAEHFTSECRVKTQG